MRWVFALILSSATAFAQPTSPTPEVEALGAKLMQEINANIQCNANGVAGRRELESLKAELRSLKEKYEAEKKDAK